MIDLLFFVEIAWCTVWLGTRPLWRALLYTVGIVTAAVTGLFTSSWLTSILAPPASAVFRWLTGQVEDPAEAVGYLHAFLPPQAAAAVSTANMHQWIAYSILRTMILLLITMAIFWLFVLVVWLVEALWDVKINQRASMTFTVPAVAAGIITGIFVSALTGYGIIHAAWLRTLSDLSLAGRHSFGIYAIELATQWLRIHQPSLFL